MYEPPLKLFERPSDWWAATAPRADQKAVVRGSVGVVQVISRRIETLADQPERRTIGARSAINAQQTTTTINARVRVNACATKPINGGPARSPA
jgi:hypothetical protein